MADYPTLSATLAALSTTKDDPQDTEAASKLAAVDRQTRNWLYDFLSIYIDPSTGKFRSTAFLTGSSLPQSIVRGTNPVDGSAREIAQGSIRDADIADASITGAKFAAGSVNGDRLADNSVPGSKLQAGSVTSDKIGPSVFTADNLADGSVTTAKLAGSAVTSDKVASGAITQVKMALRSVAGGQLPIGSVGQLLIGGNGPAGDQFDVKSITGAISIDKDGVAVINAGLAGSTVSYARLAEKPTAGTNGGTCTDATKIAGAGSANWWYRGATPAHPWTIADVTRVFLSINGPKIYFLEGGKYWVQARAPGRKGSGGTGLHKVALFFFPDPSNLNNPVIVYGTNADAADSTTVLSEVGAVFDVQVPASGTKPYFYIGHYFDNILGSNHMGIAVSASAPPILGGSAVAQPTESYAQVTILRIQEALANVNNP